MDEKLSDEDKYQAISFVSSGAPESEAARLKLDRPLRRRSD